jgi:MbtH protein
VSNPFDEESAIFHVLVNAENQHSLWPEFADVPAGWQVVLRSASRAECIDYVNEHWTDMRPKSLADAMSAEGR